MRKSYTTSIDTDVSDGFKNACEERGVKMNVVLEAFMNQFANDEFVIEVTKTGMKLKIDEK